jgi:hypothetical protein
MLFVVAGGAEGKSLSQLVLGQERSRAARHAQAAVNATSSERSKRLIKAPDDLCGVQATRYRFVGKVVNMAPGEKSGLH